MSTMQTAADIPLQIRSPASASERRITPSWTISQLKARLEPITGIPAACQRLSLNLGGSQPSIAIDAADEDVANLAAFPLQPYAEIYVSPCSYLLGFEAHAVYTDMLVFGKKITETPPLRLIRFAS